MRDLLWNSDSTVLAVWLEDMTPGEDGQVNTYGKLSLSCVPTFYCCLPKHLNINTKSL